MQIWKNCRGNSLWLPTNIYLQNIGYPRGAPLHIKNKLLFSVIATNDVKICIPTQSMGTRKGVPLHIKCHPNSLHLKACFNDDKSQKDKSEIAVHGKKSLIDLIEIFAYEIVFVSKHNDTA